MLINRIFICGAGIMGSGIAQVSAVAAYEIILMDISEDTLANAVESIRGSLIKLADKGKIKEDISLVMSRISTTISINDAIDADFVIEAVKEEANVKKDVFAKLDEICKPGVILATNTSAISISSIAGATKRGDKVIGTHFFSPVPLIQLVELVRGIDTSNQTLSVAKDYVKSIGKISITANKDVSGFLVNRIAISSFIEAVHMVEEDVGTPRDIDLGMRLASGHSMGPLETADLVGLDFTIGVITEIYKDTGHIRFRPPRLLQRLVTAGHFGRKTGKGFYDYTKYDNT